MRDQNTLGYARAMRSEPTVAEARLWYALRAKRFSGFKFRRQAVVGPFICDFTCRKAMIAIEVDGESHGLSADADASRTRYLEARGWRAIRFTNADVLANGEAVLERIATALGLQPLLPGPLP